MIRKTWRQCCAYRCESQQIVHMSSFLHVVHGRGKEEEEPMIRKTGAPEADATMEPGTAPDGGRCAFDMAPCKISVEARRNERDSGARHHARRRDMWGMCSKCLGTFQSKQGDMNATMELGTAHDGGRCIDRQILEIVIGYPG